MTNLVARLATIAQDRRGVTAMEYGLIAIVIIAALTTVGANLSTMFGTIAAKLI